MYGCIGPRVSAGGLESCKLDSGYIPLAGMMCRSEGSVLGCGKSGAPG